MSLHQCRASKISDAEQSRRNDAAADTIDRCTLCGSGSLATINVYVPGPDIQSWLVAPGERPIGLAYGLCGTCRDRRDAPGRVAAHLERLDVLAAYMAWQPPIGVADECRVEPHDAGRTRLPGVRPRPDPAVR